MTHYIVHIIWILEVNCPPPTRWIAILLFCFNFLCLSMANLIGINVMSISFIYRFYFLLHSHSDQLKYYPLFLIFLCCSCLCTLSLSSDCLNRVVISWIIDAKCMSIFDRLFTFWCSPTLAGCPTALCFTFLSLYYIYILCLFL